MQNSVLGGQFRVGNQIRAGHGWSEFQGESESGKAVIIRKLDFGQGAGTDLLKRLEAAREKLGSISEQSCSAWLAVCEHDGAALVISRAFSGKSLAERIDSEGPLSFEESIKLAYELASYLRSLHKADILQGFFEAENISCDAELPVPVVTGPAPAVFLDLPSALGSGFLSEQAGIAPELFAGNSADPCSDVYALGAVLYQALTAHPVPRTDLSPGKTVIVTWLPSRLRADIPEELDQLVGACLHPERKNRLSGPDEVLAVLEGMLSQVEEPVQPVAMGMEDSLVGQTLGPYRLVERLGQGGMAAVYKGYEPALNRYVAIKILPQFFASDPNFTARFHREAKAVAQLTHPNIVPIYNFGEANGITYIAMQLVHGGSLKYERGERMGFREALQLLLPITRALGYAHQHGVIHRDVKPSNVLISEDGWPLLADFGLAKMTEATGEKLTGTGVGMGTPMYMSPEQGQGVEVDHRSDIYSLGIMLYELVTGDVPFRADTPMAIVIKHMTAPMPMPRSLNPDIPEAVESIILKATAKDKADRFQTAEEMIEAMERVLAGSPLSENLRTELAKPSASAPAKQTSSEEKKPRRKLKPFQWVSFAILGILGACLLSVALMGIFTICPPQGPWPQPPWCEGSPFQFSIGAVTPVEQSPILEPAEQVEPVEPAAAEGQDPLTPELKLKICQITDTGGVDDKSFNASAWKGVEDAVTELGVEGKVLESQQQTDFEKNINAFIEEGCDLIIPVGFLLADATAAAAEANPDQIFAIVDVDWVVSDNVANLIFQTDEAAFMAGYLAAAISQTGTVGTFGGMQIPTVTIFMDGFYYGVQYFNEIKSANVKVLGWNPTSQTGLFTNTFESTDDGRSMGESLMDEGADVILPVAGPVGLGTAAAVQDRGNAWIIGVDADWTLTAPEYTDVILTSVLKLIDTAVFDQVARVFDGTFEGGVITYTLADGGVGLASNGEIANIDEGLRNELEEIKSGIINGTISVNGE
ncbi:MAG: BMP family ABC transporter substrate-binding protein [Anaerolineales bacterium]|nr:BMP family ABC transporter substrate-binding protein [Anaerolineales bacterium]